MTLFAILLTLFLLAGSVLGWVAFLKIRTLTGQLDLLRKTLRSVVNRLDELDPGSSAHSIGLPAGLENISEERLSQSPSAASKQTDASADAARAGDAEVWTGVSNAGLAAGSAARRGTSRPPVNPFGWLDPVKDQWMIWLGGLSVSLAGIFLVRYSIEQGLLGPAARVTVGILSGLALHGLAEWLRRYNKGHYNAFAALAGGASITLYAALLAALLLYELLPPLLVFGLLALISLFTLSLALVHGPVLAILGILGAYIVPLLVDTGSDSILGLYLYSLIITAAAIFLMRRVYRPWLWLGMLAGSLGWWCLSLTTGEAEGFRSYYLAALAYLFLALPDGDWVLQKKPQPGITRSPADGLLLQSLTLLVLASGIGIQFERSVADSIFYWTPLAVILLLAGGNRPALQWIPVGALAIQLLAWFGRGLEVGNGWQLAGLNDADQASFLIYAGWMTALHVALGGYNYLRSHLSLWVAMVVLVPLAWLSLSYLLVTDLSQSVYWGALALLLGLGYLGLAFWRLHRTAEITDADKSRDTLVTVWLILAGHFGYALAVTIVLREASLTLALATQLISLIWLMGRFQLPALGLLIKAVLGLVVVRLTLNPWLLSYSNEVHWSLWTYGGSTLLAGLTCHLASGDPALRKWLEAATLHLLVLTLWAETRYWLYEGNVYALRFELTEFAINTAVWSTLALVYYRRHLTGQLLAGWYLLASRLLLCLSAFSYALVLFPLNPAWGGEQIGSTPVFNLLLLAFGYPVLASILLFRFYDPGFKRYFAYAGCLTGFVFVNLEIRHLWQESIDLSLPTGNGELYTYTIVWLLASILVLLAGSLRYGKTVYQGGMALLLLVVAKIFLVDMADLEGLLRVTTFLGLGLSLLGLAYLYQRFNLTPGVQKPE